jgi:RNA polymerase sigma-70 factor (ECF subfamily)
MKEGRQPAAEGHLDAEALFVAHAAFIAGFLRRLGVGPDEVDDLVQDVFLVAHSKGGYSPGPAQPRSWLGAIALRLARGNRRARARRREDANSAAIDLASAAAKGPAEKLELQRSLQRVQDALETLDLDHRAAFILYELEGESCKAIAASLDVPVGTIYSRLHTARRRFMDAYDHLGEDERLRGTPRLAEGT